MDDNLITQFAAITDASPQKARQYLQVSEGHLEQAIELFFTNGGVDLGPTSPVATTSTAPPAPHSTRPHQSAGSPINLDDSDNDEMMDLDNDDEPQVTSTRSRGARAASPPPPQPSAHADSDEAMARRLQEELYAGGDTRGAATPVDAEGYRAPIARTQETLVGPGDDYDPNSREDMRAMMMEQMRQREMRRRGAQTLDAPHSRSQDRANLRPARNGAPGIFNQTGSPSIWDRSAASDPHDEDVEVDGATAPSSSRAEALARATGGASTTSAKSTLLAEMYRPPFELIARDRNWESARSTGRDEKKWLLVNVQDPSVFDCQLLNRDIWKDPGVRETVRAHFVFLQYDRADPRAGPYRQYYFPDAEDPDAYPHIAIVDPRTGEQVRTWSGRPAPKPADFLMQLHEFLERFSLEAGARNPVPSRPKAKPKASPPVEQMSEDQQLALAMKASLENGHAASGEASSSSAAATPPVALAAATPANAPAPADADAAPDGDAAGPSAAFAGISATTPHVEPPAAAPGTTRVQFKLPTGGRVVRRFALADPVRRLFEWIKADPAAVGGGGGGGGAEPREFELAAMGAKLVERLDDTVEAAGLRNGTVMVEFVE